MQKEDLFFIATPFVLTAIFIVFGYKVLVAQTPEASISLSAGDTTVEFLEEADIKIVPPQNGFPESIIGPIVSIPLNQTNLDLILSSAQEAQSSVIYISVPITMTGDNTFVLTDATTSNEENVMRWTKLLINKAHAQGLHAVVGLTINATSTISDPAVFAVSYGNFLEKWATLANESSVSTLLPGITVGHPLYSQISASDMDKIIATIQTKIRQKYLGRLGINMCCSVDLSPNLAEYSFLTVIPTPEFPFADVEPIARKIQADEDLDFVMYYDRDRTQVTSQIP